MCRPDRARSRSSSSDISGRKAMAAPRAIVVSESLSEPVPLEETVDTISRFASVKRSEEHTSELQSLMRISYAVFCLKKKKKTKQPYTQQLIRHNKKTTT